MSALPTGTVTFLMTDVEGSTRAWQAAPETLTPSIVAHYRILEDVVAEHGGARPEEQGEGDSVVAVFADPAAAVAAAVAAQRRLRTELAALPVRAALHTGPAQLRNERNYVGLTIIRCARIRSSGHGGQILLSDATATATRDRLPDATVLVDLGRYGLRGLRGRDRIWQLNHPDLQSDFPPLSAGASSSGNLPAPVSAVVGRRREIAEVSELVDRQRLVTLTGPAGIGKSRLAMEAASGAANSFGGGAWWVALPDRGVGSAAAVEQLTAAACSVDDVVAHFTSVADALVVYDGCDRWAQAVGTFATDLLLARCPDVRVLVTARAPLRVPGQQVWHVRPLDQRDAIALFARRYTDAGGGPGLDEATVEQVCRRLHGVPGSIELAARRAAVTSVDRVLAGLDEIADAGVDSGVDLGTEGVAVWGLHQIETSTRHVLHRLCVFRSPFTVAAALAVAADRQLDRDAVALAIRELVAHHLLEPMGDLLRLPERVRAAVADDPERPERGVADRHAAWFVARAEEFEAAGSSLPTSWIAEELADVLEALAHARRHDPKLALRILAAVGARWHELPVERADDALTDAARWLAGRSPSDGELAWTAAVARLAFATADESDSPVRELEDEALAIAELDHDEVTQLYLHYRTTVAALADGEATAVDRLAALADRALDLGVLPVADAAARRLPADHPVRDRIAARAEVRS